MRSFVRTTTTVGFATLLGLASGSALAADHAVAVGPASNPFGFSPATVNIAAGDTVTWTYAGGGAPHNVQSDPGAVTQFRCANGCDGDGGNGTPSAAGWTATVTFPTPGTIGYFCFIHGTPGQGMFGTINVTIPVELQTFEVD